MTVTAGTAQGAIQAAVYTLLSADSVLLALASVYDDIPDGTTVPYVAIGEWAESADDSLEDGNAGIGSDCALTLHTYTDDQTSGAGFKVAQSIDSRVKVLLHDASLSVAGFTSVLCLYETSVSMRDVDEQGRPKRHIASTYRIAVEAT